MIPVNKLGWMAGVLDLKGRIVRKNNKKRATQQLVLMVDTKELFIVRELSSLTGTRPESLAKVNTKDWMRRGCSEHCPEAHIHVGDEELMKMMPAHARWTITGAAGAVVVYNLQPYLMSDRGFIEFMDESLENSPLVGQGSAAVFQSLRRLAELGWEMPDKYQIALE